MNILLWIIQVLLALLFLFAGIAKFVMPLDQIPLPALFLKFIGVCEVLGGLGLILPGLLRRQRYLTPLATSRQRARTLAPSSSSAMCTPPSRRSRVTAAGTVMRAPNFCACSSAARVSSAPEMPAGNPR